MLKSILNNDSTIKSLEVENQLKIKPLDPYGFTENSIKHLRKRNINPTETFKNRD